MVAPAPDGGDAKARDRGVEVVNGGEEGVTLKGCRAAREGQKDRVEWRPVTLHERRPVATAER